MEFHPDVLNYMKENGWYDKVNVIEGDWRDNMDKLGTYDGVFFKEGQPINQGNIYDFDEDSFIDGCERVIEKVKENRTNEEGLKLQEEFTYEKTTDSILEHIEKVQ
mgnify:CR=1 FL=1